MIPTRSFAACLVGVLSLSAPAWQGGESSGALFVAAQVASGAPLGGITGIVEGGAGRLFVSQLTGPGSLVAVDLTTGAATPFVSGLPVSAPGKLMMGDGSSLLGFDVILADWNSTFTGACCTGGVLRFDPVTAAGAVVSLANPYFPEPYDPACLDLGPGGAWPDGVYVGDFEGNTTNTPNVYRIRPDGVVEPVFMDPSVWTGSRALADLEFDRSGAYGGDLFVLDPTSAGAPPTLWRVTPASTTTPFYQGAELGDAADIAFGRGGVWGFDLYVLTVDEGAASLLRVRTDQTVETVLALPAPTGALANTGFSQGGGLSFSTTRDPIAAYGDAVYRIRSAVTVESYCAAGQSAAGCTAVVTATGTASATASSGFSLDAVDVEGDKDGLFFFGTSGRQANPWGNGTSLQCVRPPVRRGGLLSGSGTAGACDGSLTQDLNAYWCPTCQKPAANPGSGTVVQAQFWYRDPLSTSNQTTSLSNAIEFVVCP